MEGWWEGGDALRRRRDPVERRDPVDSDEPLNLACLEHGDYAASTRSTDTLLPVNTASRSESLAETACDDAEVEEVSAEITSIACPGP